MYSPTISPYFFWGGGGAAAAAAPPPADEPVLFDAAAAGVGLGDGLGRAATRMLSARSESRMIAARLSAVAAARSESACAISACCFFSALERMMPKPTNPIATTSRPSTNAPIHGGSSSGLSRSFLPPPEDPSSFSRSMGDSEEPVGLSD